MRRKVTPKLTQAQIIDLLIDASAYQINNPRLSDGKHYWVTEFIQSKNLPTLAKMAKRGILTAEQFSNNSFTFSESAMAQYAAEIRTRAIARITTEFNTQWDYAMSQLTNVLHWYQYKFLATNKRIEHSPFNNPDFCFFEYSGIVGDNRIHPKPYPTISNPEDRVNQLVRAIELAESITRAEIGAIPLLTVCAY